MKQKTIFGQSQLAIPNNNLGQLLTTFQGSFSCFQGQFLFILSIIVPTLKSCKHNISLYIIFETFLNLFLAQNRLNIHNQLCHALLETPPCATSIQ